MKEKALPTSSLGPPLAAMRIRWDGFDAAPGKGMQTLNSPRFGKTRNGGARSHAGIDLAARVGTPIFAVADGIVDEVRLDDKSYGRVISLKFRPSRTWSGHLERCGAKDDDGVMYAFYAHLSTTEFVHVGKRVRRGEVLGATGISGNADQAYPHLHFELRKVKWPGTGDAGLLNRIDPEAVFTVDFAEPFEALAARRNLA